MTADDFLLRNLDDFTVKQDGTVLDQDNDEVDLDDLEAGFNDWLSRIRKMVAAAKGEEVEA